MSDPITPVDSEQANWFMDNLLPHEPILRAWLARRFPEADNIDDIVQDADSKALQARQSTTIHSPKSFLFAAARNLALKIGVRLW